MESLHGHFELQVDSKGRVILPKRLKEQTGNELVMTRGIGGCLYIFTPDEWLIFEKTMAQLPFSKGMPVNYFFNPYKTDVTADKQGRIQVSQDLRNLAEINENENVVLIGNGKRLELWNPDRFSAFVAKFNDDMVIDVMDQLGF